MLPETGSGLRPPEIDSNLRRKDPVFETRTLNFEKRRREITRDAKTRSPDFPGAGGGANFSSRKSGTGVCLGGGAFSRSGAGF